MFIRLAHGPAWEGWLVLPSDGRESLQCQLACIGPSLARDAMAAASLRCGQSTCVHSLAALPVLACLQPTNDLDVDTLR